MDNWVLLNNLIEKDLAPEGTLYAFTVDRILFFKCFRKVVNRITDNSTTRADLMLVVEKMYVYLNIKNTYLDPEVKFHNSVSTGQNILNNIFNHVNVRLKFRSIIERHLKYESYKDYIIVQSVSMLANGEDTLGRKTKHVFHPVLERCIKIKPMVIEETTTTKGTSKMAAAKKATNLVTTVAVKNVDAVKKGLGIAADLEKGKAGVMFVKSNLVPFLPDNLKPLADLPEADFIIANILSIIVQATAPLHKMPDLADAITDKLVVYSAVKEFEQLKLAEMLTGMAEAMGVTLPNLVEKISTKEVKEAK